MNIFQSIGCGAVLLALTLTNTAPAQAIGTSTGQQIKIAQAADGQCSPVNGTWSYLGKPGPIIYFFKKSFLIDMRAYGRPTAYVRKLTPTQIEVNYPDAGILIGTLNGQGRISWNDGTIWQAEDLEGTWKYAGTPGPKIKQSWEYFNTGRDVVKTGAGSLEIDMSSYGRPVARGSMQASSSSLSVTFADMSSTPQTGIAVSPTCIKWSDGTAWTR
jgi:hypothetical protein